MLLASVLRQRFAELTLGDLREILTSPLGRGLDGLKIADLSQGVVAEPVAAKRTKQSKAAPKAAPAPEAKRAPGRPPKAAPAKKANNKKANKKPAKRQRVTSRDFVIAVFDALKAVGAPQTSGELRAKLGGSSSTVYRAVTELIKAGKVRTEGKPARYSVIEGSTPPPPASAGAAPAPVEPAASPSKRTKKEEVSARTLEGRAQYHSTVLGVLKSVADWIGASQLRAQVGGSDNQIRIALHRLMESGQVSRRGERNSTEYRFTGK